jgi:hypothetical protein
MNMNNYKSVLNLTFLFRLAMVFAVVCILHPLTAKAQWTTSGNDINNTNSGNVGIGTGSAPTRKLEVRGGSIFHQYSTDAGTEYGFYTALNNNHFTSNLYFDGQWKMIATGKGALISTAPNNGGNAFTVYSDNTSRSANAAATLTQLFAVTMNGTVGVGAVNPLGKLHIVTSSYTDTSVPAWDNHFFLVGADANAGAISLSYNQTTNTGYLMSLSPNTAWRNTVIQPFGGKVGIGTTAPVKTLDVVGDVNASGTITGGNIQAKYQDVAEWVESSQQLSAGTVVVLDPDKNNQVVASTQSYDSRVAGVISLQPGIALGEHGEGRVLVAATGRVKVKVEARNGPIKIGDLLVTSDKEGFAMKSVPVEFAGVHMHRPGTLIGKALEPLAQGTGEILVLLSLQ